MLFLSSVALNKVTSSYTRVISPNLTENKGIKQTGHDLHRGGVVLHKASHNRDDQNRDVVDVI